MTIVIDTDGIIKSIYQDGFMDLYKQGKTTITRMSNVEPCPEHEGWCAAMYDGMHLGPFELRQGALDAEINYLEDKLQNGSI